MEVLTYIALHQLSVHVLAVRPVTRAQIFFDRNGDGGRHTVLVYNSIYGPHSRRRDFQQMPVGIAEVEADATPFPMGFVLYRDCVLCEPRFPSRELRGRYSKCQMQPAVAVMRRRMR